MSRSSWLLAVRLIAYMGDCHILRRSHILDQLTAHTHLDRLPGSILRDMAAQGLYRPCCRDADGMVFTPTEDAHPSVFAGTPRVRFLTDDSRGPEAIWTQHLVQLSDSRIARSHLTEFHFNIWYPLVRREQNNRS